jgi:hypothetical protein
MSQLLTHLNGKKYDAKRQEYHIILFHSFCNGSKKLFLKQLKRYKEERALPNCILFFLRGIPSFAHIWEKERAFLLCENLE